MPKTAILGSKWDINTGIPDLTGKVALVTGANSSNGIGWHVACHLALHGARVYIGARSEDKALSAIHEMQQKFSSNGKALDIHPFVAELSDLKAVKKAAEKFVKSETRLDILVNNAALVARPLDFTPYGVSVSFSTNHLGPFVLTTALLELLKKTAENHPGVRVVNVSSAAHALVPDDIRLSSVEDFNAELGGKDDYNSNLARYGLSKLANILFTKELQRRFDQDNISAIALALHPGIVVTDGTINFTGGNIDVLKEDYEVVPVQDGATTPLFAATNRLVWEDRDKYKAQYLMPFGVLHEPSKQALDTALAKELWQTSERVVNDVLTN